jgi:predicted metalloprotease with PDZ domain
MPANGNAGWIDEAIASWSDRGFPRASVAPNRNPVNLGGYSPYKRETTQLAYSKGSEFLSELDWLFAAQGGLRPLLKDLFAVAKRQTITVQTFQNHLESRSATTLQQLFDRYVYGKGVTTQQENPAQEKPDHFHPRRYTRKELVSLR